MRRPVLALALVVALFGSSSRANAGIVDITLYKVAGSGFNPGDVTIRTDPGINLVAVAMNFHGAVAETWTFAPLTDPPNVNPATSLDTTNGLGDKIIHANPPAVLGEFIQTGGFPERLIGTITNPGAIFQFDCSDVGFECAGLFGGGVVDFSLGDITDQTSYLIIVPEPSTLALLVLALAGLARRASEAA